MFTLHKHIYLLSAFVSGNFETKAFSANPLLLQLETSWWHWKGNYMPFRTIICTHLCNLRLLFPKCCSWLQSTEKKIHVHVFLEYFSILNILNQEGKVVSTSLVAVSNKQFWALRLVSQISCKGKSKCKP